MPIDKIDPAIPRIANANVILDLISFDIRNLIMREIIPVRIKNISKANIILKTPKPNSATSTEEKRNGKNAKNESQTSIMCIFL